MTGDGQGQASEGNTPGQDAETLLCGAESDRKPTLSVVLPTLNEEEGIRDCITRIKSAIEELGVPTEILVSDSSTDRTAEVARELGAIVVEPDRPGYGHAYRYAFRHVRGRYVAMGDADTTYDFADLPRLFGHLTETGADIVIGSRLQGEIRPGAMPALHQYVGNPALTRFLNVFYDAGVSDAHSGFRVFTHATLEALDLHADGMEFASEMVMDASVKNLTIEEVPITYYEREGEATLDSVRDGWRHVKFMLVNAPGYLFSVPGVAFGGAGLLLMCLAFFGYEIQFGPISNQPVGIRSMIAGALLTLVGYQVASMGVFATVVGDPIRRPADRVTQLIVDRLSLERGVAVGVVVLAAGVAYAGSILVQWWTVGYESLPPLTHDIAAFTLIVLGMQTVFGAFFMSTVGTR